MAYLELGTASVPWRHGEGSEEVELLVDRRRRRGGRRKGVVDGAFDAPVSW